jgi:hypothetical protein
MVYNDITNGNGLLQLIEHWAGFNSGDITGDANLKKLFTSLLNRRLEKYNGRLGAGSRLSTIDDLNYTDQPFSYFDIVDGQHDYQFLEDEDENAITDITSVMILTGGGYKTISKLSLDNEKAEEIMSPNSTDEGIPTGYIERNLTVFLTPIPNYDETKGGKIFYKRGPSCFTTSDTTKEPGIPLQFHQMLAVGTAYDWVLPNKSNKQTLITRIENELNKWEKEFETYVSLTNPQRKRFTPKTEKTR